MISGTTVAILSDGLPREMRGRAIGLNTTAVYLGLTLGPLAGGFLTSLYGWRSLFILKAIVSLTSLILGTRSLYLEYRRPRALHPKIFRIRLLAALTATLLNYNATFAIGIVLSNYLQKIKGLSPDEAGLILTIQSILQTSLSPLAGYPADIYDPSLVASTGMAIITFSVAVLSLTIKHIYMVLAILGIMFALFASPNTTSIMNMSPREAYGTSSALIATMRSLGQALSTSIITTIITMERNLLRASEEALIVYVILSILATTLSIVSSERIRSRIV